MYCSDLRVFCKNDLITLFTQTWAIWSDGMEYIRWARGCHYWKEECSRFLIERNVFLNSLSGFKLCSETVKVISLQYQQYLIQRFRFYWQTNSIACFAIEIKRFNLRASLKCFEWISFYFQSIAYWDVIIYRSWEKKGHPNLVKSR